MQATSMGLSETVKQGFVTGLVLIAPLAVTVFVVELVYGWLVGILHPVLGVLPADTTPLVEPLAVVTLFGLVTAAGITVRQGVGDTAVARFDQLVEAIPGVRAIYSSARQASTALAHHEGQFERVALVEWPDSDLRTVAFVTSETPPELREGVGTDEPCYDVFVPMVPNPMGGFLAVVPEHKLTMTDLSVREGLRIVVTTGMSGDDSFDAGRVDLS